MTWHETDDVETWLAAVGPLLLDAPGVHTITLTIVANARVAPDGTRMLWWTDATGSVTGAASQTPGFPPLLAVVPEESLRPLVDLLSPTGVNAPTAIGVQFGAITAEVQGRVVRLKHAERLYRLGTLISPEVPGSARVATTHDEPLLVDWFHAFITETGVFPQNVPATVHDRVSYGALHLWEVEGQPVAFGGRTREAFGGMRIGPIYTPPEHRRKGYGAAVTAAVSREAQSLAQEVVLFTDLSNPTANALYPRLGYRPVTDRVVLLFDEQ